MPKVKKIKKQKNIDSNIEKIFTGFIDEFLPKKYTDEVMSILPKKFDEKSQRYIPEFNANQIRVVKHRRGGNNKIINALKKVAEDNMNLTL